MSHELSTGCFVSRSPLLSDKTQSFVKKFFQLVFVGISPIPISVRNSGSSPHRLLHLQPRDYFRKSVNQSLRWLLVILFSGDNTCHPLLWLMGWTYKVTSNDHAMAEWWTSIHRLAYKRIMVHNFNFISPSAFFSLSLF